MDNIDKILQYFEKKAEERIDKINKKLAIGKESILFLLSPMSYCNFQCIYCDIAGFNTKVDPSKNLKPEKIYRLIDIILEYKKRNPLAKISISWHGYEPLQYNFEIFKEVDKKIYEAGFHLLNSPEDVAIHIGIQTNGWLLNENTIRFAYERKWKISVSLDGPKEVHDYARKTRGGAPTYERIMKNIEIYEKYFGKKPFIISVWTKKHLEIGAQGYYDWLKENNFRAADIHYPSISPGNYKVGEFYESLDKMIRWFIDLYEIWKSDNSEIVLYPFVSFIEALIVGRGVGRACFLRNGCYRVIELSYDGYIRFCDKGVYNTGMHIDEINKLEDLLKSNAYIKLFMRPMILKNYHKDCSVCKWFPVCQGGCPAEASYTSFVYGGELFGEPTWNKTNYCELHKSLFEIISKDLEEKGIKPNIYYRTKNFTDNK